MAEIKLPGADAGLGTTAFIGALVLFNEQFGDIELGRFYGLCAVAIAYIAGRAWVHVARAKPAPLVGEIIGKEET
ncbi:MAG TPA: hypothetical protein VGA50_04710 [Kiloniellales bacterium]